MTTVNIDGSSQKANKWANKINENPIALLLPIWNRIKFRFEDKPHNWVEIYRKLTHNRRYSKESQLDIKMDMECYDLTSNNYLYVFNGPTACHIESNRNTYSLLKPEKRNINIKCNSGKKHPKKWNKMEKKM